MESTVQFLRRPPLPLGVAMGYRVLFRAAVATMSPNLRDLLGIQPYLGAITSGRMTVRALQWSMGSSPSWWIALQRTGTLASARAISTCRGSKAAFPISTASASGEAER